MTNRQKQAIATKQKIFDVTMRLGMKRGFNNLRITDICSEANVSVGTFYNYFRSIDAVFQEQYKDYDAYMEKGLAEIPLSGSCGERVMQLFSVNLKYVIMHGTDLIERQYKGMFEQTASENEFFYAESRVTSSCLTGILEQGLTNGELQTDIPACSLARAILIFYRGITIDWALHNGAYDLRKYTLNQIAIYLNQFLTEKIPYSGESPSAGDQKAIV